MSLRNPESRWWNRDSTRKSAAYVLWTAAIVLALVGTWSTSLGDQSPLPLGIGLLGSFLPIPLIVGGSFLLSFGTVDGFNGRVFVWVMALYFIAIGVGTLIGNAMADLQTPTVDVTFSVFIIGGVLAIAVSEGLRLRGRRKAAVEAQVRRTGISASGVVTRARHYSVNERPVTRVTVQFTDSEGRSRWSSASVPGTANKGETVSVRYSQQHLGRRGGVLLRTRR